MEDEMFIERSAQVNRLLASKHTISEEYDKVKALRAPNDNLVQLLRRADNAQRREAKRQVRLVLFEV